MTRDIPSAITSIVAAQENPPRELYEVFLDSGTLFFAQAEDFVVLGTQTYTPIGVTRSPIRTSGELEVDEVTIQLANVDLAFSQRAVAEDFIGRRLVIKTVFTTELNSGSFFVRFDGRMDEPVIDQMNFTIKVRSFLDALHHPVPRRIFSTLCNWQHYDTFCAVSKTLGTNLITGTAIASSTAETLVSLALSGFIDKYWGPIGTVKMFTGSNSNIGREVIESMSLDALVRIPFPFTITSGDIFSIQRGCRKTITDCITKFDNWENYGGFPTTPKHPII